MKTILYLVRHGEVHNPDRVIYGRLPGFPLSERGRRQAHKLGKFLSSREVTAIYASPLARAQETASIVSSYVENLPVVREELLLEVHSPHIEGKPFRLADEMHWDFYQRKFYRRGQERKVDLWKRMKQAIDKARQRHQGKSVVLVSHGDPIMLTIARFLRKPFLAWEGDPFHREHYVDPAKGFQLTFASGGAPEVSKLEF
jgi:broad specificity phosphatase PhoE